MPVFFHLTSLKATIEMCKLFDKILGLKSVCAEIHLPTFNWIGTVNALYCAREMLREFDFVEVCKIPK